MNNLTKSIQRALKVSLLATTLAAASVASADSNDAYGADEKLHDAWLDGKVESAMLFNNHLNNFDIDTEVRNNTVYLSGVVKTDADKDLAETVAENIEGVISVKNNLKVNKNLEYSPQRFSEDDERSWSVWFDDAGTTASVKTNLMMNSDVDSLEINVDTFRGVVTLSGDADNRANRNSAIRSAKNTEGVRRVINKMTVDGKPDNYFDNNEMYDADWSLKDAWIDGKIEASLLVNTQLNNFTIDTEVDRGKAILSGTVKSDYDKALATEITQAIEGVTSVHSNLVVDRDYEAENRSYSDDEERNWSTWFNDITTTSSVKSQFLWNDHVDGLDINVDTMDGIVTLNGTADNVANRKLAEEIAAKTDGVRKVVNNLTIDMDG